MRAEVFWGQLAYVDTDGIQIQITDRVDNQVTTLDFDAEESNEYEDSYDQCNRFT